MSLDTQPSLNFINSNFLPMSKMVESELTFS